MFARVSAGRMMERAVSLAVRSSVAQLSLLTAHQTSDLLVSVYIHRSILMGTLGTIPDRSGIGTVLATTAEMICCTAMVGVTAHLPKDHNATRRTACSRSQGRCVCQHMNAWRFSTASSSVYRRDVVLLTNQTMNMWM